MTGIYLAIGSEKQVKPLLFLYLWYVIFTQQVKPKDSPPPPPPKKKKQYKTTTKKI